MSVVQLCLFCVTVCVAVMRKRVHVLGIKNYSNIRIVNQNPVYIYKLSCRH